MKLTNTTWFWVLQLFGWGLFIATQRLNEIFNIEYPYKYFVILYSITIFFFGILCTTLLRYFLKNQLSFDQYKKREIMQISIAYMITSLLLSVSFFITNPIRNLYANHIEKFDENTFLESLFRDFD